MSIKFQMDDTLLFWRSCITDCGRGFADQYDADLIPLDERFATAATRVPASHWLFDRVHPAPVGHALRASAWFGNLPQRHR